MAPVEVKNDEGRIYGFGIAGKWAVSHFDEVVAFVDTDMKIRRRILGISVEGPSYLDTLDYSETQVVVSVVDIMMSCPFWKKGGRMGAAVEFHRFRVASCEWH